MHLNLVYQVYLDISPVMTLNLRSSALPLRHLSQYVEPLFRNRLKTSVFTQTQPCCQETSEGRGGRGERSIVSYPVPSLSYHYVNFPGTTQEALKADEGFCLQVLLVTHFGATSEDKLQGIKRADKGQICTVRRFPEASFRTKVSMLKLITKLNRPNQSTYRIEVVVSYTIEKQKAFKTLG